MRTLIIGVLVGAATSLVAATQQQTYRPGEATKAQVWVQNRGRGEAIPVDLREVNTDAPLRVQVVNAGVPASPAPLPVTIARPTWEYKSVVLSTRDDTAAALRADGQVGWETTGIMFVNGDQATLLLKRLR